MFLLLLLTLFNHASSMSVSLEGGTGFFMPHRLAMLHLPNQYPWFVSLRAGVNPTTPRYWHQFYRMSRYGAGIHVQSLGNDTILGYGFALFPYLHFEPEYWAVTLAAGPGLVSKKWERDENHKNTAIGTHLNIFIKLAIFRNFQLTDNMSLSILLAFVHFSNMAIKMPNLGINYLLGGISISTTYPPQYGTSVDTIPSYWGEPFIAIQAGAGMRASEPADPTLYPMGHLRLMKRLVKTKGRWLSIFASSDFFINTHQAHYTLREYGITTPPLQAGTSADIFWYISCLYIHASWGYYLFSPHHVYGEFYHRIGMGVFLTRHLSLQMTLNAHFFKAHFLELGLMTGI